MAPERIAHYRIVERLGAGGMGIVFRAEDIQLRRPVALKVLPEALAKDPVARERLLREARSASQIVHPHVATIYEAGEAGGQIFVAMEFVGGESLAVRLRRSSLSIDEIARIGSEVADALATAHAHGVVHRDVKPGNILLSSDGGSVKVVDFGLAIHGERPGRGGGDTEDSTETRRLTQAGHAVGTIPYMSPEQVRGEVPDGRSDLFSLGVVLYEAATGRLPFDAPNALALSAAILHDDPTPPRSIRPEIPPPLEAILLRLLEKNPASRPENARVVRAALEALREGRSSRTIRALLVKPGAGTKIALAALAAATLGLGLLVTWPYLAPEGDGFSTEEAKRLFEHGRLFEDWGGRWHGYERAEGEYRKALKIEPGNALLQATLCSILARRAIQDGTKADLPEIEALSERSMASDPELAPVWICQGHRRRLESKPQEAIAAFQRARDLEPANWRPAAQLGEALVKANRGEEGLAELHRAVEVGGGHPAPRNALAANLFRLGRLDQAAAEYGRVLESSPDDPVALNNLGAMYLTQGRYVDTIQLYQRFLKVQPDAAVAANLGYACLQLNAIEEAVTAYELASRLKPQDPVFARNLAEAYEAAGRAGEARQAFERAAAGFALRLEEGGSDAVTMGYRAFCEAKLGRLGEAHRLVHEAVDLDGDNPDVLFAAAQVHALAGRRDETYDFVRRSIVANFPREAIRSDACFRSLRSDPRFLAILTDALDGT